MKRNVIKLFVLGLLLCGLCYSYSLKKSGNASLNMSELTIRNMEALANDKSSVTCEYDKGDTCMVGSTPVKDYDEEDDDSWF